MKAPYKVLFSNDTTNIHCTSPYHQENEPFRLEMLEATVDETAGTGIQVHILQPGCGWVPWWRSEVYPAPEHYRWWSRTYNCEPDDFGQYMLAGGDMVRVFIDRCRVKDLVPFISLRLNDHHGHEYVDFPPNPAGEKDDKRMISAPNDRVPSWTGHCLSRFMKENQKKYELPGWAKVLDWAFPEVRRQKMAFIEELCGNYDLDGFELDFMRHVQFFRNEKPVSERMAIMTDFVRQVREVLDRTSNPGQRRWLGVRVPCHLSAHAGLGIDLPAFAQAGVDMVTLSSFFFTEQQTDLPIVCRMLPETAVYLEVTYTSMAGPVVRAYNHVVRRMTDEQFYTAAHLAYARGAVGICAFNFVYYRPHHHDPELGPFHEPPFHIFKHIGDPAWVARQPQHYFLGKVWELPEGAVRPLPKEFAGQSTPFALDMAPPADGWKKGGRLRIQSPESLGETVWRASFNGVELKETADRSEPYSNPYPPLLGTPEHHRAWIVPVTVLKDGINTIEITMTKGEQPATLVFLDVAVE